MFRVRFAAAIAAVALVASWPAPAWAGGWPWPVAGQVVLPYGQQYTSAGGTKCTHGGMDIGAEPGATVRSCVSGQVTFSGRVPAGEGAQAFAVTVLTSDGLRVTYLPLRSISVKRDESVSAGGVLGELAEGGDASSARTHVHLGVRRGETRLDPASFLGSGTAVAPAAPVAPRAAKRTGPGLPVRSRAGSPWTARSAVTRATPVPSHDTAMSLGKALHLAVGSSSSVLAATPTLSRVRSFGDAPVLDAARLMADLRSGRSWLAEWLVRLALAAVGGACVVPVLRSARGAGRARQALPVLARRAGS
jgi:hypothetical protein